MGFPAYIVGDATTPAIGHGDLLMAISGSGETKMTHHIASVAKAAGAKVFLLTSQAKPSIGDISDQQLVLPNAPRPTLPLKSAFEGAIHILLDAVVILVMEETGVAQQEMMKRHSNLE
jgi:6-phospho-3-hexuloisomerase